jgi:hypothetical protein
MPPAAHPLLDLLVVSDDLVTEMPLRSSSASSSPKKSNKFLEIEPFNIAQKTIPNDETTLDDNALKNPTTTKSKRVRFLETTAVQVIKTIHILDLTDDELSSSFYSATQMRDFQRERRDLARMLDQGISAEEIFLTTGCEVRGIESATYNGNRHRHGHISEGIHCVMTEQELQNEDCNWNSDFIAHIYRRNCEESLREAHERGLKDEEEISEDLEVVRNMYKDFAKQTSTAQSWLPEEVPFGLLTWAIDLPV